MLTSPLSYNVALAWLWVLLGFISGMLLGLNFHRENWLGGYASQRRRFIGWDIFPFSVWPW